MNKIKYTNKEKEILKECRQILKNNPKLKRKKLNKIKDLEKRLYYYKCWFITELQPLKTLKNYEKRCFMGRSCFHLDHIVSISYGFLTGIPPEKIGNISNLRFIPSVDNLLKGSRLTEESHKILRKFKRKP